MVRSNHFWTLEISQRIIAVRRTFVQEKWLTLSTKRELCGIWVYPIPILTSPEYWKSNSPHHSGNQEAGWHWKSLQRLQSLQSPIPRYLLLTDLSMLPLLCTCLFSSIFFFSPILASCMTVCLSWLDLTQSSPRANFLFTGGICLAFV